MLSWLSPLVRKGLTISVVNTGQMITRELLDNDIGSLMTTLISAFGSHAESRKKAVRVAAAWEKKRADARQGKDVTRSHRRPKWIEVTENGTFYVTDCKRRVIESIFKRRIAGIGKGLIAKELNVLANTDPAFAPWPIQGKTTTDKMWTSTYVGRIICNRAVLGEWQPFRRPRNGIPVAVGEPIEKYYPAIIDPTDFRLANEKRIANALTRQGRGRGLSNLLGTRARCASCNGQMSALGSAAYHINRKGEKRRHYFLYCQNAKVAHTCDNQMGWTYDRVEGPILDVILSLAMDDQHFPSNEDFSLLEVGVHHAKSEIDHFLNARSRLLDLVEAGEEGASERYQQRERDVAAARERLAEAELRLEVARGKVSPADHLRRVAEVRELMWDDDPEIRFQARSRVKRALSDVIESIKFHCVTGNVTVVLVDRLRVFSLSHSGVIISDLKLDEILPSQVGPQYGKVTVRRAGGVSYSNDLSDDQKSASAAYISRRKSELTER